MRSSGKTPRVVSVVLVTAVAVLLGCGGTESGVGAVESMPRSIAAEAGGAGSTGAELATNNDTATLLAGDGPQAILEFGLFGPVVPVSDSETYEADCRFDDDPYETCL